MLTASKTLAQRPEEQNGWKAWTTPGAVWTRPTRVLAAAVLIAGLLAYATVRLTSPSFPRESAGKTAGSQVENRTYGLQANGWAPRLGEQSIAVLPFSYRAAADSSDYFSLGMTDELIVRLSQVEDLSVISRSSSMKYQDGTVPPHEIGRELGVAYVLEGRVQQFDGQVRVQVQLIDVRTDQNVWAQGFTRAFEDVLQLQVDLAREIARQLKANLMPRTERQMASAGRVDSAAYALYLQARQLRFLETAKGLSEAVRLLRRSITRDSTFAPAWATLSFCAWLGPILGSSMPEGLAGHSLAREAARRALELDSTSAKAHVAMGTVREVLDGDFPAAGLHYQRAIRLNPGLANAHREYGLYFARMGRFEIAERSLRKAARLNPASPVAIRDLGRNALRMGSYDQAKRYLKQALALLPDPTVRPALWTDARPALWEVYFAQDSVRLALRKIRRVVERNSHVVPLAYLGRAYASLGRRDSAKLVLRRIQQEYTSPPADAILSPADAIVPTAEAVVRAALGQSGRAAELLKQADFFRHSTYLIKTLPMLDPLRGEPLVQRAFAKWGIDEVSIQRTMERLSPELPDIEN